MASVATVAEVTPTLDYLTDAAHLMQTTAPETSAHLMSQRGDIMWHRDIALSEVQRQHVCGACGNIMIPGNSSTLKLDARRARYKAKSKSNTKKPEKQNAKALTKVVQCSRCDKTTRTKLDPIPRSRAITKSSPSQAVSRQADSSTDTPPKPANTNTNASSKKRPKNRKAGLQALLSGQQQQKSKSLSLADFMQK